MHGARNICSLDASSVTALLDSTQSCWLHHNHDKIALTGARLLSSRFRYLEIRRTITGPLASLVGQHLYNFGLVSEPKSIGSKLPGLVFFVQNSQLLSGSSQDRLSLHCLVQYESVLLVRLSSHRTGSCKFSCKWNRPYPALTRHRAKTAGPSAACFISCYRTTLRSRPR